MASQRREQFVAPAWLTDVGFSSWLLAGFLLILVGLVWLLSETSTIVMPVIFAAVLGAVAGPAVGKLEGHGVPRIGGAVLVLLGLVAGGDISTKVNQGLDRIEGWVADLGVDRTEQAKENVQAAAPEIRSTFLEGVFTGISGLSSLLFFLAFATLSSVCFAATSWV